MFSRKMHRAVLALGLVSIVNTLLARETEAIYHLPWTRSNAVTMALSGVNESYDSTGSHSVWTDDDLRNELGADCSGFVNKSWALDYYFPSTSDYHGPYNSQDWFNGPIDGVWPILMSDSRTRFGDAWVREKSNSVGHMGMFGSATKDSSGKWKIIHAASTELGIYSQMVSDTYFDTSTNLSGTIISYPAKRFKRTNW